MVRPLRSASAGRSVLAGHGPGACILPACQRRATAAQPPGPGRSTADATSQSPSARTAGRPEESQAAGAIGRLPSLRGRCDLATPTGRPPRLVLVVAANPELLRVALVASLGRAVEQRV